MQRDADCNAKFDTGTCIMKIDNSSQTHDLWACDCWKRQFEFGR